MKDKGKAFQAIAFLHALPHTSSSLSFRVCTRLPTSQAMCTAKGLVIATIPHEISIDHRKYLHYGIYIRL